MNRIEENLYIALGKFIRVLRSFITSELFKIYGNDWEKIYTSVLSENQILNWKKSKEEEFIDPKDLIDFGNLFLFALKFKYDFFSNFLGKRSCNNLPTHLNELSAVRNQIAHYQTLDSDKAEKAFLIMIEIAKELKKKELEQELRNLKGLQPKINKPVQMRTSAKSKIRNNRPSMVKIVNLIQNTVGIYIDKSNTNISTINSNDIYSVEPNFSTPNKTWYLVLINQYKKIIYLFEIPVNDILYKSMYKRSDRKRFRLEFDIDDNQFKDKRSKQNLNKYLTRKFSFENNDLIYSS